MISEQIEKIKQEYTDKYVVVDPKCPELARFGDVVGQVKTINMSGRALVEFADYHLNIGWYDIDLDYLKVVDKPEPKEEKKPAAKKSAAKPAAKKPADAGGEKKLSPLEMARQADSGAKKAKPSTADILAAARGGAAAPAAPKEESKPEPKAEAKPAAPPASGKMDRSKMSVADMLAAARGGSAPAAEAAPAPVEEEAPAPEPAPVEEAAPAAEPETASDGGGKVDKTSMSVDDMVAYCRDKDAE